MKTNELQLKLIVDSIPALICYIDAQERYRFANRAYEHWCGRSCADIYGKLLREVVGEQLYLSIISYVEEALAGETVTHELLLEKNGGRLYYYVTLVPDIQQENVSGFFVLAEDITDQKNTEVVLRQSKQLLVRSERMLADFYGEAGLHGVYDLGPPPFRNAAGRRPGAKDAAAARAWQIPQKNDPELKLVIDSLPTAVCYVDVEQRYRFANKAYEDRWEHTSAEIYGRHIREVLGPKIYAGILPYIEEALAGEWVSYETMLPDKGSGDRHIYTTYVPDSDHGQVRGFFVLSNDITEQKRTEQALRESEKRSVSREQAFSNFFDNAGIGLRWVNPDGVVLRANRAELDLLGYTSEEYIGRDIADIYVEKNVVRDVVQRLKDGQSLHNYPARMRCRDGSIKHVLVDSNAWCEDGKLIHTLFFTRDVSAAKAAEDAVHVQANLLDAVDQAIIATNLDGIVIYWNKFSEALYGWKASEIVGRNIMEITVAPAASKEAEKIMALLRAGKRWSGEFLAKHRSGKTFSIRVTDTPIFGAGGELIGIVSVSAANSTRTNPSRRRRSAGLKDLKSLGVLGAAALLHHFHNSMALLTPF